MRKIELLLTLVTFSFFISQFGMAQNQTLRINIELPAGVGLSSNSSLMSSPEKNLSLEALPDMFELTNFQVIAENGSLVPLIWIKFQTYENSQFLLDYKNQDQLNQKTLFYFLNDNTNNLQSARSLKEFPAFLTFNQKGLLISSFVPRRIRLTAWLGVYAENPLGTLILEYF